MFGQTKNPTQPTVSKPVTATAPITALGGVAGFVISILMVKFGHGTINIAYLALFVMVMTALGVFIPDVYFQKIHHKLRGDNPARPIDISWKRTMTKFAGLLGSVGFVALCYWFFPEYHGSFYDSFYLVMDVVLPFALVLAIPYINYVDARMAEPKDGLWHLGCMVTFHWGELDWRRIWQHLLGWMVKGFFLPLMFTYVCSDLSKFMYTNISYMHGFKAYYDFLYDFLYFVDVGICACGYMFAMHLTDTHIRSTEPTIFGWIAALLCYEPFWSLIGRQYLAYEPGRAWGAWLAADPTIYVAWGILIIGLTFIYVWATVVFGMRFSNLTHRGIITSGPYRWSKHPAYISKNLSWWLISMPFMVVTDVEDTLRHCALLLMLNLIYYLRAKTEERHLSRDPVYVTYAAWVNENGLFGIIRRWAMKFGIKMPASKIWTAS
jgi:hypothetical protein